MVGGGRRGGGGGGGGGADVELDACLCRYTSVGAPNWCGRTPRSQTPGVPATLDLNVQMDGGRKMLQNCSKITPPQHLNIPSTNESEAPPGSLREHSDVHNRKGTAPAVLPDSFPHYLGHTQPVVAQRRACQAPHAQRLYGLPNKKDQENRTLQQLNLHNRDIDHPARTATANLYGLPNRQDHEELSLRHEREVDDIRRTATLSALTGKRHQTHQERACTP